MDMDRIGLFSEMSYITIGDTYNEQRPGPHIKGKNFYVPGVKKISATQAGYFTDTFSRIMEGEAYCDPVRLARQYSQKESKKNLGKEFIPSSGFKTSCGVGSYYGTIGGPIPALSPTPKPAPPFKPSSRNIFTNPPKKGTGYGYAEVTLNPYPKYLSDPISECKDDYMKEYKHHKTLMKNGPFRLNMHPEEYFTVNPFKVPSGITLSKPKSIDEKRKPLKPLKPFIPSNVGYKDGGMKAGTFERYPTHSVNEYVKVKEGRPVHVVNKSGNVFVPLKQGKSRPTTSILQQNVLKAMNSQNYKTIESVMSY
ncbi:UPF0602 protein C4orf47 homolog [Octopus bimaculoides]|uniref:Cilia-and flagella-associated protein 96 n=1 Tax=Octopus bimaculoides TaxID=37653 RepID=A0A0L8FTB7_OCTBM|nr:UPF0602 protein C4orf47 homolog [Octopus bimaculoides]|eukprot:XP_014787099.1 PREDICTED: UPF0602 protein C4orf47 homolog [Octopus bimaculoides]